MFCYQNPRVDDGHPQWHRDRWQLVHFVEQFRRCGGHIGGATALLTVHESAAGRSTDL